ncbi:nuclear pore complex subunit Nup133 [Lecanosticta acicola]|uniref:Nuclear pore complex subunit Nup133 n=1 Tax=Lecanosticta acicola TaxID=111012 RepID=A0AAI8Z706_9PEZI|nr:nuclear pore complex subunit Nup133 [Lecanosticta acicola]
MSNSQTPDPGTERRTTRSTAGKRRQTQLENDGTQSAHRPKRRKNNAVKEDTFKPRDSTEHVPATSQPAETETVPVVNGSKHPPQENGSVRASTASFRNAPHHDAHMVHRPKRAMRGDGATTLAHNQCYNIKILPSTPKELREPGLKYRGSIGIHNNALAVTHQHAIVWDYTAHLAATSPRKFDMPFPCKASDPLPFGALVSNGASTTDLGLLFVSATTGKVVFYDSIDRAASLGLFQDRKTGVEGSIGNFSGETVVDLVPADHAGFVVVLSSGRLVQLTLRDTTGKVKISSQFLRTTEPNAGFFGRFWDAGFRKDLSAIHTRPLNAKGQLQAMAVTEKGELLFWDMDWTCRSGFRSSIDCKDMLQNELRSQEYTEMAGRLGNFAVLDVAISNKQSSFDSKALAAVGADTAMGLLLLLRIGTPDMHTYTIADISLEDDAVSPVKFKRFLQLSAYENSGDIRYQRKPRLLLPKPGHTIFVVFEDATILVAADASQHPSAAENNPAAAQFDLTVVPETFEQAIKLRRDRNLAFSSTWEEAAKGSHAQAVAFVEGAGLVRITAADVNRLEERQISPKTRIEQAVFHGCMQADNIIDFSRPRDSEYSIEDVEEAALAVSQEILRAETPYTNFISQNPANVEDALAKKAKALKALVDYVRQNYPAMSRATMWRLLWDAERVAAAKQLWVVHEEQIEEVIKREGKRKATLLDEVCSWFSEEQQEESFASRKELKELLPVPRFFVGGLHRLDQLLHFTCALLKDLQKDKEKSPTTILRLAYEANDVWARCLDSAFDFRLEHSADYGILAELVEDGVLIDSAEYVDLPEFWTSTETLIKSTVSIAELSRHFATSYYDPNTMPNASESAQDIAMLTPKLVELFCLQARECVNWHASRHSQKEQVKAKELQRKFDGQRYDLCRALADVGQSDPGMKIAEKYRDMHTLSDMVIAEEQYFFESLRETAQDAAIAEIQKSQSELEARIRKYFDRYGSSWSDTFFDKLFVVNGVGESLDEAQMRWRKPLTKYLRAHPSRYKICWINDITSEGDFAHAAEVLEQSAEQQESRLWAKKVELSMSKLALLAAEEGGESIGTSKLAFGAKKRRTSPEDELTIVAIQEKVYKHFQPELRGMIDRMAEMNHCMENYGSHVSEYRTLRGLLENDLQLLLAHIALDIDKLIDVLTLMDMRPMEHPDNLQFSEFFLALQALEAAAAGMPPNRFEMLLQLIWKRCYIYDDWAEVKLAKEKSDTERRSRLRRTAAWQTLYYAMDSDYFEQPGRHVRMLTPSECLGSACLPQDLSYRFPNEELLDPILQDCKIQDEFLQSYVADRNLDEVVEECQRDVRSILETDAEERAMILQQEREFEQASVDEDAADGFVNGLLSRADKVLHGSNGHLSMNGISKKDYADHFAGGEEEDDMEESDAGLME